MLVAITPHRGIPVLNGDVCFVANIFLYHLTDSTSPGSDISFHPNFPMAHEGEGEACSENWCITVFDYQSNRHGRQTY